MYIRKYTYILLKIHIYLEMNKNNNKFDIIYVFFYVSSHKSDTNPIYADRF